MKILSFLPALAFCVPVCAAAEPLPPVVAKLSAADGVKALRDAIAQDRVAAVQQLETYASALCPPSERRKKKFSESQLRAAILHAAAVHNAANTITWLLEQNVDPNDIQWNAYNHHAHNGRTPLHLAARHAQVEAVRALLAGGANPNAIDAEGNTPLMSIAPASTENEARACGVVELLLQAGAEPARRNHEGKTAAEMAANDKVRALLDFRGEPGVEPNHRYKHGETPLMLAVRYGDADKVRSLLRQGAILPKDDAALFPLLYAAVLSGNPEIPFLLPYYEPEENSEWESPLVVALRGKCGPEMTAALIQLGADADARSHFLGRQTPLAYARQAGDDASAAILLPHMKSDWPVMDDILKSDDVARLRKLLESRCFFAVDRRLIGGQTPLQIAERAEQLEIAELLRAAGADVNAMFEPAARQRAPHIEDYNTFAAEVQRAVEQGDIEFFRSLPQKDVNRYAGPVFCRASEYDPGPAKGRYYLAPALNHAAAAGKVDVVRVLLARGADLEVENLFGRTAIEVAAANGHVECVRLLLNAGAADYRGALYTAALCGEHAVVDYLLSRGVLPGLASEWALLSEKPHPGLLSQRKPDVDMALTLAVTMDCPAAVKRLVEMGADVNRPNFYPLHETFVVDMVRVLVECGAELERRNAEGLTPLEHARRENYTRAVRVLEELTTPAQQ